ncbi:MAG: 4Fe-4S dicluster domain-containing protein [Candidatus Omnitrophica bacterium]|nr:4Fe-4S dicluster domain-containing protein [Candidatus Omnitrophota bacterium]MBD3268946.1 4Fe-4S dicluster domain-containing protein [Candidatus Omnitrophota bacterium]
MDNILLAIIVLGSIGFCFSLILAFLGAKLKVEEDPRIKKLMEILPGLNCGACGFSGCRAFAEAAVKEKRTFKGCLPAGEKVNKEIGEVLGLKGPTHKPSELLICQCGAKKDEKKLSTEYIGPLTCRAAESIGGGLDCPYGCIGLGDCLKMCPAKAIYMEEGRIRIDQNKCINCGKCIEVCPRNLFVFIPRSQTANCYVACSNKDKTLLVKKVCEKGCIGCGLCTRVTESPYKLKDNLSRVEYEKISSAGPLIEGKNKCPTKCIFSIND